MERKVKVYRVTLDDMRDRYWTMEYPYTGAGWYWDSWIDGKPITVADGPYSTREIAEFASR